MTNIRLAGNYIQNSPFFGHLQLVYGSSEIEVQMPQDYYIFGFWDVKPVKQFSIPVPLNPENYSEKEITFSHGEVSSEIWGVLAQLIDDVKDLWIPYDTFLNSNSYVNTLLHTIGIETSDFISYPGNVSLYPGVSSNAANRYLGINWQVDGTAGSNVLVGGTGDDEFSGGTGRDFLKGGKGDDILYANSSADATDDVADYLEGGGGADKFYVGSYNEDIGLFRYYANTWSTSFNTDSRGLYDIIHDWSTLDEIYITSAYHEKTLFSDFIISSSGQEIGGRELYYAASSDVQLSAIEDTYFDENLGRSITVLVFWHHIMSRSEIGSGQQLHFPIFAIEISPGMLDSIDSASNTSGFDKKSLISSLTTIGTYASDGDDTIISGIANEVLNGSGGDDDFYTGPDDGIDAFNGGTGVNSYNYTGTASILINANTGTIIEQSLPADTFSSISVFKLSSGNDTIITSTETRFVDGGEGQDSVQLTGTISDYRIYLSGNGYNIERAYLNRDVEFEQRWLRIEDVETLVIGGATVTIDDLLVTNLIGGDNDDVLAGTDGSDIIDAGSGNDDIFGGLGSDLINGNDGVDTISYSGARLNYTFRQNTDGTVSISNASQGYDVVANVERIRFLGDGSEYSLADLFTALPTPTPTVTGTTVADLLEGTWENDVILGDLGDDTLLGDAGSDTYLYSSGDGNDLIDDEAGFTDNTDVLWLTDLNADDVELSRNGLHLLVTVTATGEVITVDEQFYSDVDYWGIERIQFADGSFLDREDILQAVDNGIPAVTVDGTAGNDTLEGTWENDVIRGGLGNDTLLGSAGSDTYIYAEGDGSDYIDDEAGFTDNTDVLLLTDLNANEISLARVGLHLEITVLATGDVITIDEQFYSDVDYWGIEKIQFADGTTMNRDAILTAVGVNQDGSLQVASNTGHTGSSAVVEPDVQATTHVEGVGIAFAAPIQAIEYDLPADSDDHTTAHSAEIISLADYLGTNIVPEQNDALWYEPEPIGAVI